jgi:glucokinase
MRLGIDIGGTKIALALAESLDAVLAHRRDPSPRTGEARRDFEAIVDSVDALLADAGVGRRDVSDIGVAVPGPLDADAGLVVRPPNLRGWEAVPVRDWFADVFDCAVHLENDANAAALAEWRKGVGQGARDFVYLTMSTGVGGGVILDGRLHRGRIGSAGELGHVPLIPGGALCACGQRGCFEAYVGGKAWAARMREEAPETSRVTELAGQRSAITTRHVLQAAREGDAYALAEVDAFNGHLAHAIAWLAYALAPEVVALGTIVMAAGDELVLDPVRARVREMVWPHQAPYMRIEAARLGDELADWAGLMVAFEGAGA